MSMELTKKVFISIAVFAHGYALVDTHNRIG